MDRFTMSRRSSWLRVGGLSCLLFLGIVPAQVGHAQALTNDATNTYHEGAFIWFDLVTDEVDDARDFYSRLFGWTFQDDGPFAVAYHNGRPIASLVHDPELKKNREDARWVGSISVPDVDGAAQAVQAQGGTILAAPEDLPGRGRSAIVQDPEGGVFGLVRTANGDPVYDKITTGDWLWVELWTKDAAAATRFYEQVIGYEVADGVLSHGGTARASIVEVPWDDLDPYWVPIILVPDLGQALQGVQALGGEVYLSPQDNLSDGEVALVADPSGGAFLIQTVATN